MNDLLVKVTEYLEAAEGVAPEVWAGLIRWELAYAWFGVFWFCVGVGVVIAGGACFRKVTTSPTYERDGWLILGSLSIIAGLVVMIATGQYTLPRLIAPEIAVLKSLIGG